MTAPFIAEAKRLMLAALDAPEHGYLVQRGHVDGRDADVALAAVVPFLAEHFAQAVEADADLPCDDGHAVRLGPIAAMIAARVIREAATPTEETLWVVGVSDYTCSECGYTGAGHWSCPRCVVAHALHADRGHNGYGLYDGVCHCRFEAEVVVDALLDARFALDHVA